MRDSSVVGLSPSRSAAPPAPRTRQLHRSSVEMTCWRSSSSRVMSVRRLAAGVVQTARGGRMSRVASRLTISARLDGVAQLAHVARPAILGQATHAVVAHPLDRAPHVALELADEAPDQHRHVPPAARAAAAPRSGTRSGGSRDPRGTRHRAPPCLRSRLVAAIRRTSTLTVRGAAPTRSKLPVCKARSSLAWRSSGSSPISSRKQRRAVGDLETPRVTGQRAGVGTLLSPEELVLDQSRRERGAVHGHQRALAGEGLRSWTARATSSLPVPVSPRISTLAPVGAT